MYSFPELAIIFNRCKTIKELEKACDALAPVIQDGDLSDDKIKFAKKRSIIKYRQLII
jgi:hypothetical protein